MMTPETRAELIAEWRAIVNRPRLVLVAKKIPGSAGDQKPVGKPAAVKGGKPP